MDSWKEKSWGTLAEEDDDSLPPLPSDWGLSGKVEKLDIKDKDKRVPKSRGPAQVYQPPKREFVAPPSSLDQGEEDSPVKGTCQVCYIL